jgi:hypothetical protein
MKMLIHYIAALAISVGAATITLAATAPDKTEIRDIRFHITPSNLPPFSTSVLLLTVGAGMALTAARCKRKPAPVPCQSAPSAADSLALLSESYAKGELPAAIVCERLAALIGARLVAGSAQTMTSTEIISAAKETFPDDVITAADALLGLCDLVRFGPFQTDNTVVTQALAETDLLLQRLPGTVP